MTTRKTIKSKVCLVGEIAVGKTSLVARYVHNMFDDRYIMTIGTKITKKNVKVHVDERDVDLTVDMTIWDIMGEKGFRQLLKEAFFYGANGILAVADITRLSTLEDLDDWIDHVMRVVGDIPVLVAVNKIDLPPAYDEGAVKAFLKAYNAPYLFTSAKTAENVERAFQEIGLAMATQQLRWD